MLSVLGGGKMPGQWAEDSAADKRNNQGTSERRRWSNPFLDNSADQSPADVGPYTEETQAREARQYSHNLVGGLISTTGDVVDDAGTAIGRITQGNATDLVGNVVTAAGDIIGKDGGIVGKALPLKQLTSGEDDGAVEDADAEGRSGKEPEGFSLMGATRGVKGLIDVVDGTLQTVPRSLPLVGDLTQGLGLTGEKPGDGLVGGLLSNVGGVVDGVTKPLDSILGGKPADAAERYEKSDDAKRELMSDDGLALDLVPLNQMKEVEPQAAADEDDAKDISAGSGATTTTPGQHTDPTTEHDESPAPPGKEESGEMFSPEKPADDKTTETQQQQQQQEEEEDENKNENDKEKLGEQAAAGSAAGDEKSARGSGVPEYLKTLQRPEGEAGEEDEQEDEQEDKQEDKQEEGEGENEGEKVEGDGKSAITEASHLDDIRGSIASTVVGIPKLEDGKLVEPFENFPGAQVGEDGRIIFEDHSIGRLVEGSQDGLMGKQVDPTGRVIGSSGSVIGKAELKSVLEEELVDEAKKMADMAVLKGSRVNKAGNLVNDKGEAIGRITEGILKHLVGRKSDEKGQLWNDNGKVIGRAEPIPETEREDLREPAPFEDFPGAVVESDGRVTFNGEVVGRLVEGDGKTLRGKKVDEEGDILDRSGNVIGKAERWEPEPEPEPEPEAPVDKSILAGKRVNKAGNVVDSKGDIYGRVIPGSGDLRRLVGRMCDRNGNIVSESGDVIGQAELVAEGEREGLHEGPFAELEGCTVGRDGKVVTPSGDVVGRLVSGDAKILIGRAVDEDGDVLDRNGNQLGHAERWSEPEPEERKKGPLEGRRVNRQGEVVDEDGNIIGKLTSGDVAVCAGKEIDADGDVVDSKGRPVGHANLLSDIPEPPKEEEGETAEEKKAREEVEADRKLARSLGSCVEQCLDRVRPICKMITQKLESAERKPKEELDEEELVKQVKPLIEEGGRILSEANGTIRALDPDGRIQRNAKHKAATRDASPEEYHLADVLKELTGTVTETIDRAKRTIDDMPHAKKELNPLWGLLAEPLFQILAAVGLLLSGVLGIVGRLLHGLGLGGIVDGLLGSLGLNRLLDGLGLGSVMGALTGRDKRKK